MIAALTILKSEIDLKDIKQQPILSTNNEIVGYHSYSQNNSEQTLSGGTHSNKDISLRICVAELIECYFFQKIVATDANNDFLTNEFPSTSGFAAGFDNRSTQFRALCEGIERWAWSQWIDSKYFIPEEAPRNIKANTLTDVLIKNFQSYKIYKNKISVQLENKTQNLAFLVFLGLHENGVFAGSRVSTENDELLEHAVIEASRNLKNAHYFEKYPNKINKNSFFDTRLVYFSKNKNEAFKQISAALNPSWPTPKILLLREYNTQIDSVYIWRCLIKNFIGWHLGDEKRFVY